jgi:hypothetical protein
MRKWSETNKADRGQLSIGGLLVSLLVSSVPISHKGNEERSRLVDWTLRRLDL